ncbi:glycoside hydrolase [Pasteurellaceae bacterium Pebbles2]|nr:glycoside hydrolase [Pasteurellaceae bacterium Pebbles2]
MSKRAIAGGVCSVVAIIGLVTTYFAEEIRTGERGLMIIGNAEGCRREPYKCPADVLTVGIGSTAAGGEVINPNKRYSDLEIAERWVNDISIAENCVNRYANGLALPQGAFEAATSITFNVGCGAMKSSTLFKYAKQGNIIAMCNQFPRWVYAGGQRLKGLELRREKERQLCLAD